MVDRCVKFVPAGAVVCLTDVDQLQSSVRSMANELLKHILAAFAAASSTISLLAEKLRVDASGLYIATVGPVFRDINAREGVACATKFKFCEMPQYLAAQYRTVAIQYPPLRLLAEVLLLSEG